MPRPYDDERYLEWFSEFRSLIEEFLDTEGNSKKSLFEEFTNAVDNAESALEV